MDIYLKNSLTNSKEKFEPLKEGEVLMYNCGPTVYNYAHIGNLRSYIFADSLRRMFEWNNYKVKQVINITDVGHLTSDGDIGEDKVEKEAKKEGKSAKDITKFYTESFFEDLDKLNIPKNQIEFPRASDYIQKQKEMICILEEKNFTYKTEDGIYFNTSKYPEYKNLFGINRTMLDEEFARVIPASGKKNHLDFALWKFSKPEDKRLQQWESPNDERMGFPGWHIECSAMVKELLGETIDIHTGGTDHIPVHHTNEIAQSICANEKPLAKYWLHNAFLNVEAEKMSKSEGNFIRLQSIIDQKINPLAFRYLILTAHYSSQLQFSWDALKGSETALNKIHTKLEEFEQNSDESNEKDLVNTKEKFTKFINDNLDTPKALALVWEIIKDENISPSDKKTLILDFDKILGLDLGKKNTVTISKELKKMIESRDEARENKDWQTSDRLRKDIENMGFEVKDTEEGTQIYKK
ncbi:MAG: cysteine--tRNA ligase [Candidatus Paceibacterota bacterium]